MLSEGWGLLLATSGDFCWPPVGPSSGHQWGLSHGHGHWVCLDEAAQCRRGTPVVFSFGAFHLDSPTDWFGACLFLWVIFFPLFLLGRCH